jgi:hypothetical protein
LNENRSPYWLLAFVLVFEGEDDLATIARRPDGLMPDA